MDTTLILIGLILSIAGIAGSILPMLPGIQLNFLALLLLHRTTAYQFSPLLLRIAGSVTAILMVLDYLLPVWGTRKYGGTTRGSTGATIGTILGFFLIPGIGMLIGPFIGALAGELLHGQTMKKSFKAARGSLIGFVAGTGIRLAIAIIFTIIFLNKLY
ncbi:MAG TPA: DUF456 domain-containing protein [Candidatus Absconditabacterales bacterium]|nr:DUF456 domain-containing protein [Candidatus Absconditabacterales bacterium]